MPSPLTAFLIAGAAPPATLFSLAFLDWAAESHAERPDPGAAARTLFLFACGVSAAVAAPLVGAVAAAEAAAVNAVGFPVFIPAALCAAGAEAASPGAVDRAGCWIRALPARLAALAAWGWARLQLAAARARRDDGGFILVGAGPGGADVELPPLGPEPEPGAEPGATSAPGTLPWPADSIASSELECSAAAAGEEVAAAAVAIDGGEAGSSFFGGGPPAPAGGLDPDGDVDLDRYFTAVLDNLGAARRGLAPRAGLQSVGGL
eukprot:tig00001177_g7363.t1